jgi:uncharacterized protein YbbC (DUF1343 family)
MTPSVRTGLDVLRAQGFTLLKGKRVGLVTHPAAIASNGADGRTYYTAVEVFAAAADLRLAALFGPEHGLTGEAQDLQAVVHGHHDPGTPVPVHSLYGDTFDSLTPSAEQLRGLDVLVIDLQDVGARYYTFHATMLYCMEAAASVGLPVVVLDRPNPIAYLGVEGPTVRPGYESFVGPHSLATAHGMTIGELARLYKAERVPDVDLTVVPCEGWVRAAPPAGFPAPWVPPSPNMPGPSTAVVYPGMCLIEGTNLSEGRGTTRPFEYVGAPGVSPRQLVDRLHAERLPGVEFVPAYFRPTFQKHAGHTCGGAFIIATADPTFRPVRTGLAVLIALRDLLGDAFRWRTETYEFVSHIPAIDLLFGSDRERKAIEAGKSWQEVAAAWEPEETAFRERRKPHLIYPE